MKIDTLIKDIYRQVQKKDNWWTNELSNTFGTDVARRLGETVGKPARDSTLRLSKMGPWCPRALWASIHKPEEAEAFPPWVEIKLTYGHMLEALAITLAKAAGHEVVGEQDEVRVDGIVGHRDCVIDGAVVDCKSLSSRAFDKLKNKTLATDDSFGYLDQIDGYVVGSSGDPLVTDKEHGYILGIDKTLGHMVLYKHDIREESIRNRIRKYREIVEQAKPPRCECGVQADGRSGNVRLDVRASYSAYKYFCHPGLRTFLYASGPTYLVKVVRTPDVTEVDRYGNYIYH